MGATLVIELPPELAGARGTDPHWTVLRNRGAATLAELWDASASRPSDIHAKLRRWERAGFIQQLEGSPRRFIMAERISHQPSPPDTVKVLRSSPPRSGPARIWSAIRVLQRFDLPALLFAAEVTTRQAHAYLGLLIATGYVEMKGEGDEREYRLVRRSGPRAPRVREDRSGGRRRRLLVNPNDGTVHQLQPRRAQAPRPEAPFFNREV